MHIHKIDRIYCLPLLSRTRVIYPALQSYGIYGITSLMPLSCPKAGGNLFQYQYKHNALVNIKQRVLLRPFKKLNYDRPPPLSSHTYFSVLGVLTSSIAPKTMWCICVDYIRIWAIAVCKLPSQSKIEIKPTHIWSVIIENMVRFSCLGLFQRRENIQIYCNVIRCHLKCPTSCLWEL